MLEKLNLKYPLAIIGMGLSGQATFDLLLSLGCDRKKIATFDSNNNFDYSNPENLLNQFRPQTLVVSPGISLATPWIKNYTGKITSELEIATSLLINEKIIAVTGSLGKSTTVSLLDQALNSFCENYFVGGNIGVPLAVYSRQVIEGRARAEWVVLELSSYQLETYKNLLCEFSAITYFTPNHMERYIDLEQYYETKWTLIEKTKKLCVLNFDSIELKNFALNKIDTRIVSVTKNYFHYPISLLGKHNRENYAVALSLSELAGWPDNCRVAMSKFPGLKHRFENLGIINGVQYINDSKATTIESVISAVHNLDNKNRIHLLIGGRDKNLPWDRLQILKNLNNLSLYFFGECAVIAKSKSRLIGDSFNSLSEAVTAVKHIARAADTVLLSPGGTSLDEFKNFEDRGEYFRKLVSN